MHFKCKWLQAHLSLQDWTHKPTRELNFTWLYHDWRILYILELLPSNPAFNLPLYNNSSSMSLQHKRIFLSDFLSPDNWKNNKGISNSIVFWIVCLPTTEIEDNKAIHDWRATIPLLSSLRQSRAWCPLKQLWTRKIPWRVRFLVSSSIPICINLPCHIYFSKKIAYLKNAKDTIDR